MTENKTTMNGRSRQAYEPVKVKLMKVTPQGVLCASPGGVGREVTGGLTKFTRF